MKRQSTMTKLRVGPLQPTVVLNVLSTSTPDRFHSVRCSNISSLMTDRMSRFHDFQLVVLTHEIIRYFYNRENERTEKEMMVMNKRHHRREHHDKEQFQGRPRSKMLLQQ